ncbi:hypothetical protein VPH35_005679 [Triticum aestivum]
MTRGRNPSPPRQDLRPPLPPPLLPAAIIGLGPRGGRRRRGVLLAPSALVCPLAPLDAGVVPISPLSVVASSSTQASAGLVGCPCRRPIRRIWRWWWFRWRRAARSGFLASGQGGGPAPAQACRGRPRVVGSGLWRLLAFVSGRIWLVRSLQTHPCSMGR